MKVWRNMEELGDLGVWWHREEEGAGRVGPSTWGTM